MIQNNPQEENKIDYIGWLKNEVLEFDQIVLLSRGVEPHQPARMVLTFQSTFKADQVLELLRSGSKAELLKNPESPITCLQYLRKKGIPLPSTLIEALESDEIQQYLIKKTTRSKESYTNKETRDDEPVLLAVMKTLLDLFPELSKDDLISLKPIQNYANGVFHSSKTLKDMISKIEGKNRSPGNKSQERRKEIKRTIPANWFIEKHS